MNSKLSWIVCFGWLVVCAWLPSQAYIIVEPHRHSDSDDQILINTFSDNKQLESNALSAESGLTSDKVSENRTFDANQTVSSLWLKASPVSVRRSVSKTCHSCNKDKQSISDKDEYNQRLEYIKHQILSKLGLSEAPKLLQKNADSSNCKSLSFKLFVRILFWL